mgnify:CR=1 FL=1
MLYELFNHLGTFPGARLMTYISFRAIVAGGLALLISIWFGNYFIDLAANIYRKHNATKKLTPLTLLRKVYLPWGVS